MIVAALGIAISIVGQVTLSASKFETGRPWVEDRELVDWVWQFKSARLKAKFGKKTECFLGVVPPEIMMPTR